MKKPIFAVILVLCITLLVSCDKLFQEMMPTTDIKEILSSPDKFNEKTVKIKGKVKDSFIWFGMGYFVVADKTGEITVIPRKTMPKKGDEVTVIGKVNQAMVIGTRTYIIIVEDDKSK